MPETDSDTEDLTKSEKFKMFDQHYEYVIEDNATVEGEAFPENDSYHVTYEMRNLSNSTITRDDRVNPLFAYNAIVAVYNEEGAFPQRDHTFIPDRVDVTFVTEDGQVYETSFMKYNWSYKEYIGDWSFRVFLAKYASTIEDGPAHPDSDE